MNFPHFKSQIKSTKDMMNEQSMLPKFCGKNYAVCSRQNLKYFRFELDVNIVNADVNAQNVQNKELNKRN
ncbi:CLUMA_CG012527, isoform A [Clunio marinus]|uniref:CLUMA_CG012527, isoform A n=1 Tax=Clunio marinus TaxID=568069 RepID=A0A1J1IG75_9DIPT|nr:CLUMA_CG012527, isoform A [Clunio marinus]